MNVFRLWYLFQFFKLVYSIASSYGEDKSAEIFCYVVINFDFERALNVFRKVNYDLSQ